jgi:type IV pilus assembly protein PilM
VYSFQLTKNFIGIDFGTHSLKIAECQRAGEKVTLLNYDIIHLPVGIEPDQILNSQEQSDFVRDTLKTLRIRTSDTVSEVTGPWTVSRYLIMPDLADDEMREAIRWGSKADFPFALEDAIIDFNKLGVLESGKGEPEAEIISAVATREVIEEQVTLLKRAGLKPLFLSIPSFSLMQAYRVTQPTPWAETAVIVDLGYRSTQIIVLKDGNLKFSREIAIAGDAFTQSLTGDYEINGDRNEVDESLAERIKIKIGLLGDEGTDPVIEGVPLDQVQKRLGTVMDRLQLEIERSLSYYKNQFKDHEIQRVLLTGGGSLLKGLPEALEKNIDIPVNSFQTTGSLSLRKKINKDLFLKDMPFLTTLLGLVTQTKPFINLSSQFSIPQVRKISPEKLFKPVLASLLPLGVVLFFGHQYWTASQQVSHLQEEITAKKEQLAQVDKPLEEMARLELEEGQLNKEIEGFPKIKIRKILFKNLLQELSRLVPSQMTLTRFELSKVQEARTTPEPAAGAPKPEAADSKKAEVKALSSTEMGRRDYQLRIQGLIFGSDQEIIATLSEFTRTLNRSSFFQEAKVQTTLKSTEYSKGAAEFKIQTRLKEGSVSS